MVSDNNALTTRRRVLATVSGVGIASLAGCPSSPQGDDEEPTPTETPKGRLDRLDRYPRVRIGSVDDLSEGDVESFSYPLDGANNFLTHLDDEAWSGVGPDESIVAYSSVCTHMGCSVGEQVKPDQEMAGPCPCHFTTFDLSKGGLVVSGAATTDLPQVRLDVEDDDIYATGIDGLAYGYRHNLRDGEPVESTTGD